MSRTATGVTTWVTMQEITVEDGELITDFPASIMSQLSPEGAVVQTISEA